MKTTLDRFLYAQQQMYADALAEISSGKKRSHWMWFIFPQLLGLGQSDMAMKYGIQSAEEAQMYLAHPILGKRLIAISKAVLDSTTTNATQLLGSPDDLKLRSCMTLFSELENTNSIFQSVLDKFFSGQKDPKTLSLLS